MQAPAQSSLEAPYRCTGDKLLQVFEPQRQVLQVSSALILDGRTEIGYGTIVSSDGYILTKASEFEKYSNPVVIIDRTKYESVEMLATDTQWDVCLLKVDAKDLVPVKYAPTSDVAHGTWVVANGVSSRLKRRLLMGVISARVHRVPPAGGLALGIVIKEEENRLVVGDVNDKGGAGMAGMKSGDVIVSLEGKPITKIDELSEGLEPLHTGSRAKIGIARGEEKLELEVELFPRFQIFPPPSRNDQMSGDFSKRRSDFPRVVQHSILGSSKIIGGPLLDLEGRCLGMNIARANRAESFAIPVEELKQLAERLMSESAKSANSK